MEWLSEARAGSGRRAGLLLGLLLLTALWALSTTRKQSLPAGHEAAPRLASAAGPAPEAVAGKSDTPQGWGRDPFDPSRRPFEASHAGR
jgi:hypothetical protein